MTLEQEFESFMNTAFKGQTMTGVQYKCCERVYYAGCITLMDKFLNLPEDKGDAHLALSSLIKQLQDISNKI